MIKKMLAVLLGACLLAVMGAACTKAPEEKGVGSGTLDPASPVNVTLWHYYMGENQKALEDAVAEFNTTLGLEQGINVTPVAKGSIAELEEAVSNSALGVINSEPMPDLFSSYPDKALEIDALGVLCDLNTYFDEAEKNLYVVDFLKDGFFSENRLLLLPIVKSTELLYVNATAFNEFSGQVEVSAEDLGSWEGIYEVARAYYQWKDEQTPDVPWNGKGFMGIDSVANYVIVGNRQLGVEVIDGAGTQIVLDEAVLRRLFDIYYKGYSLGYFDAVGKFRSDDIKAGELAAYAGSTSGAAYFPTWIEDGSERSPIEFMPIAYPVFEGGTPCAVQQGAGMCVAVSTPEKQEAAALFLKWFTSPQQNITFAMTTGYLPVQTASYGSETFTTALAEMRSGDAAQNNVASAYEIALNQILKAETYAAQPFPGSYRVRGVLQSTLMGMADEGRKMADVLKAQGLSEEEVLAGLDVDARFAQWMDDLRANLDNLEVSYTV